MSKERTSLSLDPEVAEYLRQDSVNASGLVNKLVKRHMNGGASESEIREFRLKQLEGEYKDAAAKARRKLEEYNNLQNTDPNAVEITEEERNKMMDKVLMVPREESHPLVEETAEKLDMTPAEVLTEAYE